MTQQTRRLWMLAGIVWFAFCGIAAQAQIMLKPNGREAIPLRVKAMKADVTIEKQFASTKLVLTFQNETPDRIEADFIYTLPPDTLVTSFAYWYGSERVPAKIMEKEEAAAIYRHITTRMHDPALIELVGKRTFRARIFPVMPNANLRVEMTFAQSLAGDAKGALFTFPLQTKKGDALDSVNVRVRVKGDDQLADVTNANGLPVTRNASGYELALKGTNFRPQQDLRVRLVRKPQLLRALLYAAPAERGDSYFALALTPIHAITHPKLIFRGVPTQDIVPSLPANIAAGQSARVFGRYRGSGRGTVTLSGQSGSRPVSLSQSVAFGKTPVPGNLASKLWAVHRMEELSVNGRNRAFVILLSKKFGLPGKYTSWLAVPKEEMERYESEIAEAKIETLAKRLYAEIRRGRTGGVMARNLRAELGKWAEKRGESPKDALRNAWGDIIGGLANRIAEEAASGRQHGAAARQAQSELRTLTRMVGGETRELLRGRLNADIYDAAGRLANEVSEGRENSHAAQRLRVRLQMLCRMTGEDSKYYLSYELREGIERTARAIVAARHDPAPDTPRIAILTRQLQRMAQLAGQSPEDHLTSAESNWRSVEYEAIGDKLFTELRKSIPDASSVKTLEDRLLALYGPDAAESTRKHIESIKTRAELTKLKRQIADAPNFTELVVLKKRQAELEERESELRARSGDPLIRVEAPSDAQQVIAILPGSEIKRLDYVAAARSWQARFDIPTYATEGEYVITVIIVLHDGTRRTQIIRYHVDTTPPTGTGRAQLANAVPAPSPTAAAEVRQAQATASRSAQHLTLNAQRSSLRLELDGGHNTARVRALLPWGETVELKASPGSNRFFAVVAVPTGQTHWADRVRYILTDRAHNRTVVTVDMEQ